MAFQKQCSPQPTSFQRVLSLPIPPKMVVARVNGNDVPLGKRRFPGKQKSQNQGSMKYELAFAFTFYKVQGVTVSKIILDVSKRPKNLGRIDFHELYVSVSRVRKLDDMRIVPLRGATQHLEKLKKPAFPLMKDCHWLTETTYL